jgi:uncharacterized membrane protein YeaQ/YmgE (transglycosylase-associated protein family)
MKLDKNGMTLVETLVAGIIGAVIASIILSIITTSGGAINEGVANARSLRKADVIESIIGGKVRNASTVMSSDELWADSLLGFSLRSASSIISRDTAGVITGGFRKNGSAFQESSDGAVWSNVTVGGEGISISSDNPFILHPDRKRLTLDMDISTTYKNRSFSMSIDGVLFKCRN